MKKRAALNQRINMLINTDPFFQNDPYEIHRDTNGEIIGEVFLLPAIYLNQGIVKRSERHNDIPHIDRR